MKSSRLRLLCGYVLIGFSFILSYVFGCLEFHSARAKSDFELVESSTIGKHVPVLWVLMNETSRLLEGDRILERLEKEVVTTGTIDNIENLTNETHVQHKEESDEEPPYTIAFLFGSFVVGALVRCILRITGLSLPYTVILLVIGALYGLGSAANQSLRLYTQLGSADPHVILHVFLPVLIFESAFSMDAHTFFRAFVQVVILAVPGLVLSATLTAAIAYSIFNYGWTFDIAMLFGSIVSATDPVAVVALLKEIGASEELRMLIEGESLLNDGSAIVMYKVMHDIATSKGKETEWYWFLLQFVRISIGGPLFGFIMAKVSVFCLRRLFNDTITEITITLVAAYFTFYVSETLLEVSGVLALVVLGVCMSAEKTCVSPEVEDSLHHFWEMLAYLSNTVIFILVGIVITEKAAGHIEQHDWLFIFTLYIACNIIRLLMVILAYPLLTRIGHGLSKQSAVIVVWGGLRGAVGLALALLVARDPILGEIHTVGPKFLIHTAGLVALTLLLNATTFRSILYILGMSEISTSRRIDMASATKQLRDCQQRVISELKLETLLSDANWDVVEGRTTIHDPYQTVEDLLLEKNTGGMLSARCTRLECSSKRNGGVQVEKHYLETLNEGIIRLLKALKISYWRQFEKGILSETAVRHLCTAASYAEERPGQLVRPEAIEENLVLRGFLPAFRRFLSRRMESLVSAKKHRPTGRFRGYVFMVVVHPWFEVLVACIVLVNVSYLLITMATASEYLQQSSPERVAEAIFFTFYFLEACVKIYAMGPLRYFRSHWNQLDVIVLMCAGTDLIIQSLLYSGVLVLGRGASAVRVMALLAVFRLARLLRLVQPLLPAVHRYVTYHVNSRLFRGYALAKGYVIAHDEVLRLLPELIENEEARAELTVRMDTDKAAVLKAMGYMQSDHPAIAVAVKTRHSCRNVLNSLRSNVEGMREGGLLDDREYEALIVEVERRMQRLNRMAPTCEVPRAETLMKQISWMQDDEKIYNYVMEGATERLFSGEEVVIECGAVSEGIFIVHSGMPRLLYRPSDEVKQNLQLRGFLPNTDCLNGNLLQDREEVLPCGAVIGELGVLTDSPSASTIISNGRLVTVFVSRQHIRRGFQKFSDQQFGLEAQMWRSIAFKVAPFILNTIPTYELWANIHLHERLECSLIVDLQENRALSVSEFPVDVLLIYGAVIDTKTQNIFVAPARLVSCGEKLMACRPNTAGMKGISVSARLLLVPTRELGECSLQERGDILTLHFTRRRSMPFARRRSIMSPSDMTRTIRTSRRGGRRVTPSVPID